MINSSASYPNTPQCLFFLTPVLITVPHARKVSSLSFILGSALKIHKIWSGLSPEGFWDNCCVQALVWGATSLQVFAFHCSVSWDVSVIRRKWGFFFKILQDCSLSGNVISQNSVLPEWFLVILKEHLQWNPVEGLVGIVMITVISQL